MTVTSAIRSLPSIQGASLHPGTVALGALPPTLVVGSVSPGHAAHDRVQKRAWHAGFGVPKYWIVDALGRRFGALRLSPDGTYAEDAAGRDEEVVRPSAFPRMEIALAGVWEL